MATTRSATNSTGQPAAKCYIDDIGSWTTNEVTINWNAPLTWVTTFLDEKRDWVSGASPLAQSLLGDGLPQSSGSL